ncbi:hypothetical protein VTN77DRAFT_2084 [Rasamsonia byssochlamydoides]|uniref:uncharacterized protein n=1 Tax=Rasamsonia byssochlamydoides TaxID=89139 RepID=UPI0037443301
MRAFLFDLCCRPRHVAAARSFGHGHQLHQTLPFRRTVTTSSGSTLLEKVQKRIPKLHARRIDIVSEELCDALVQRLSPFLTKNKPCDILDFCPGVGLLSSKIHDLLQPRRHVLVETRERVYKPFLKELTRKPSVQLVKLATKARERIEWESLVTEHLPQSDPSEERRLRNDNLLVVMNFTDLTFNRATFTPSRTWTALLEDCLRRTGFHNYGMVRVLGIMPSEEAELLIPRTVIDRKKAALLSESVALHLVNVAETGSNETYVGVREWELITKSAARAGQRTADANITTPEGRERPSIPMAPETDKPGWIQVPYVPRAKAEAHQTYLDLKEEVEQLESQPSTRRQQHLKKLRLDLIKRRAQVNQDNRLWYQRLQWADRQSAIDSLETALAQAVADPAADLQEVHELGSRLASMRAEYAEQISKESLNIASQIDLLTDNRRAALRTGNLDDAVLPWDRRPFEPLHIIKSEDLWPDTKDCAIIYFEPDPDSSTVQLVNDPAGRPQHRQIDLFVAIISALGLRANDSVADIVERMFPQRSAVEIIKAVPSLFPHVPKRLTSDYLSLVAAAAGIKKRGRPRRKVTKDSAPTAITALPLEDRFEYDLSGVRLRALPISVITDLVREYINWPLRPQSAMQVHRNLGGSITAFNSASMSFDFQAGKAAGKVQNL